MPPSLLIASCSIEIKYLMAFLFKMPSLDSSGLQLASQSSHSKALQISDTLSPPPRKLISRNQLPTCCSIWKSSSFPLSVLVCVETFAARRSCQTHMASQEAASRERESSTVGFAAQRNDLFWTQITCSVSSGSRCRCVCAPSGCNPPQRRGAGTSPTGGLFSAFTQLMFSRQSPSGRLINFQLI